MVNLVHNCGTHTHTHTHTYTLTHAHTHTHTRTHIHTYTHTHTHAHARTCTHTHALTHTHTRTHTHTHSHTHTLTHTHAHSYTHTLTHTHTHTHTYTHIHTHTPSAHTTVRQREEHAACGACDVLGRHASGLQGQQCFNKHLQVTATAKIQANGTSASAAWLAHFDCGPHERGSGSRASESAGWWWLQFVFGSHLDTQHSHTHTHTHTHIKTHTRAEAHTHTDIHTRTHTHIHTHTHAHTQARTNKHTRAHTLTRQASDFLCEWLAASKIQDGGAARFARSHFHISALPLALHAHNFICLRYRSLCTLTFSHMFTYLHTLNTTHIHTYTCQGRGFSDFLRVGSLPRMARAVLPHALHAADDSRDAVTQLKEMLKSANDGAEEALLK